MGQVCGVLSLSPLHLRAHTPYAGPPEFHPACAKALGSSHCSLQGQLPRHVLGWVLVKSADPRAQPQAHGITVSGGEPESLHLTCSLRDSYGP